MEEGGKFNITKTKNFITKQIQLDNKFPAKVLGININLKEIIGILEKLGFTLKKIKIVFLLKFFLGENDINGKIDLVEEIIRIKEVETIKSIEPEKIRINQTLNNQQRHFHLIQRSIAAKGYLEAKHGHLQMKKLIIFFQILKKIN